MPINFECPKCKNSTTVADENGGKVGRCSCGVLLRIPHKGSARKVARLETPESIKPVGAAEKNSSPSTPPTPKEVDRETQIVRNIYLHEEETPASVSLFAGVASWDASGIGIGLGFLLLGPFLLWYSHQMKDDGFLTIGLCLSSVWVGILALPYWIIRSPDSLEAIGFVFERLGFGDLTLFEALLRTIYMLIIAAVTVLGSFGILWLYLQLT